MKVICIGSSSKDIFFPTDEGIIIDTPEDLTSQKKIAFELGAKFHVDTRYEALGGCAANVAWGLDQLGLSVSCYSKVGSDLIGEWIRSEFGKSGVSTDYIKSEEGCQSDLSAIIVDGKSGDRIIFTNQKANKTLKIFPGEIEDANWIFIGDLEGNWKEHLSVIMSVAEEKKIKIAYNPRQSNIHDDPAEIIKAIKSSDTLVLNKDEALEIVTSYKKDTTSGELNNEKFLIKELKELGPRIVTLTDGMRGAWAYDGRSLIHSDPLGNNPKETTGAGDAFTSGFLAAIIKEKSPEEALKWGIANSGNSVKFYGAIEGLLTEREIEKQIGEVEIEYL